MLINEINSFNPVHTFECGQCFRWNCDQNGIYTGISDGRVCRVNGQSIIFDDKDTEYWREYFALDTDYCKIKSKLLRMDKKLCDCIEYGAGIRILKQDLWETIVSFIISANNNIPRIKRIIETMCTMYGDKIAVEEDNLFSFPSPEVVANLTKEDLAPLKVGYRDTYILDAAKKIESGEVNLSNLPNLSDKDAKIELMKIKGVGSKVADCILLFALGRFSVFPTDVWIKRILSDIYKVPDKEMQNFVNKKYKSLAGYAQQYMYYFYRNNM